MPDAVRAVGSGPGLCEIAEQFRELDLKRRHGGLSLSDAERYNALFGRLSDALASSERHRRVDVRQFLRVRFPMELVIRTGDAELRATCHNFGGGGCYVATPRLFSLGDDVWLDGAVLGGGGAGHRYALHGRSIVAWTRLPPAGATEHGYGLRFAIDSLQMRDQIDRVLYRVLDLFLNAAEPERARALG